jgi:SAM-dependent methyltransferase
MTDAKIAQVSAHDKAREAEALRRKSSSAHGEPAGDWLLQMPFAGLGMSNIRLAVGEMYNFASAVMALDPAPGDLVLDLGAGSCWVSDWLNRLLVDTVSLDIAHDMLKIGQRRLGPQARLTVGDFEALPFTAETFDGAICLSALHHVPHIPRALREIHRVLREDGVVVFSEPGAGHASHPQSRAEMAELGVLERDIIAAELMEECRRAGFEQVSVQPYLFPAPTYDEASWQALERAQPPSGAPSEALRDIVSHGQPIRRLLARGLASLLWLGRRLAKIALASRPMAPSERVVNRPDASLELAWQSLLLLQQATQAHPIVLARKRPRRIDSRRPNVLAAELVLVSAPPSCDPGEPFTLTVRARNTGDTLWLHQPRAIGGHVALGAKLMDSNHLAVIYDYGRGFFSQDVAPGQETTVQITLRAPAAPGNYIVKLDLVDECIVWFEHRGSQPLLAPLMVHSSPANGPSSRLSR